MKRALLFIGCASLLSGCVGGNAINAVPNSGSSAVSQQRNAATQVLQTQQFSQNISSLGAGGQGGVILLIRKNALAMRGHTPSRALRGSAATPTPPPLSSCSNGYETANVEVSPTEYQAWVNAYYDSACTQLYRALFADETLVSQTTDATTVNMNGSQTLYAQSGSEVSYDTLAGTFTFNQSGTNPNIQISEQVTTAQSATSPALSSNGVACQIPFAPSSSSPVADCAFGSVAHVTSASKDVGLTMTLAETNPATPPPSGYGFSFQGTGSSFNGALNALTLAPGTTFPSWAVSGGTTGANFTVNGNLGFANSAAPDGGSVTVTDTADDVAATMTATSTGTTGTLTKISTNATLGTFTTDLNGNGTITYSNGTTAQIVDWVII